MGLYTPHSPRRHHTQGGISVLRVTEMDACESSITDTPSRPLVRRNRYQVLTPIELARMGGFNAKAVDLPCGHRSVSDTAIDRSRFISVTLAGSDPLLGQHGAPFSSHASTKAQAGSFSNSTLGELTLYQSLREDRGRDLARLHQRVGLLAPTPAPLPPCGVDPVRPDTLRGSNSRLSGSCKHRACCVPPSVRLICEIALPVASTLHSCQHPRPSMLRRRLCHWQ